MDRASILTLLARRPFEPLKIQLSGGESFEIRHPEVAALGKSGLVIVDPETDQLVICALLHITSVRTSVAA